MEVSTGWTLLSRDAAGDQVLRLIADPFSGKLASQSFVASLGVSIGFTLLIGIIFSLVRPFNSAVYEPKLKHAGGKPTAPPIGKSIWAWIPAVVRSNEDLLVDKVGIDAAIFVRFIKMWRNVFVVLGILGCSILIPANVAGGKAMYSTWDVSGFMKMTPQFMFGRIFWAYVVVAYIFDIVICIFLFINYRAVVRLRRRYYASQDYQRSLYSRTLMITNISPKDRSDKALLDIMLQNSVVEDVPRAIIARNVKDLPHLIKSREDAVRELEKHLARYLQNPEQLPANRPLYKPAKKERSKYGLEPIDAIDHFKTRIQSLELEIKEVRKSVNARDAMPYGFVSYPTIEAAHFTAYSLRKKHIAGTTVRLAPRPNDLIWKNLGLSPRTRRWHKFLNTLWVVLLTLAWSVPNALIAVFLTNLSNLASVWPAFSREMQRDPKFWAVIQGVLSPAITSLFYFILPSIFRRLLIKAGDVTKTSRERHVTHKLYTFFVLNNLIIFSLFSTVWKWVSDIIAANKNNDVDLGTALKESNLTSRVLIGLCGMSPFWIFWLLQRNLGAAIDLSQVVTLAWVSIIRRFTSPTPRELIELTAPPSFDYASYYNYFLFYATVAICFAPLQPLVLPVTAFYFALDCYLKKYLLLYVFITKTESGGQFWRILFNRSLFAALLGNVVIAIVVVANGFDWKMLYALIPLPIGLLGFKYFCATRFDNQTHYFTTVPIGNTAQDGGLQTKVHSDNAAGMAKFGHPALYKKLITPMVHSNARHVLARIYNGRTSMTEDDDMATDGFSDAYDLHDLSMSGHSMGIADMKWDSKTQPPTPLSNNNPLSQIHFVGQSEIDDAHFSEDPEFRRVFVGDSDSIASQSRSGSPTPGGGGAHHYDSRPSSRGDYQSREMGGESRRMMSPSPSPLSGGYRGAAPSYNRPRIPGMFIEEASESSQNLIEK